jgi:hypothetical protein
MLIPALEVVHSRTCDEHAAALQYELEAAASALKRTVVCVCS